MLILILYMIKTYKRFFIIIKINNNLFLYIIKIELYKVILAYNLNYIALSILWYKNGINIT